MSLLLDLATKKMSSAEAMTEDARRAMMFLKFILVVSWYFLIVIACLMEKEVV